MSNATNITYSTCINDDDITFTGKPMFPNNNFSSYTHAGILIATPKDKTSKESLRNYQIKVIPAKTYRLQPQKKYSSKVDSDSRHKEFEPLYLEQTISLKKDGSLTTKDDPAIIPPFPEAALRAWFIETICTPDDEFRDKQFKRLQAQLSAIHDPDSVKTHSPNLIQALESLSLSGSIDKPSPPTKNELRAAFKKLSPLLSDESANDAFKDALKNCGFKWLP